MYYSSALYSNRLSDNVFILRKQYSRQVGMKFKSLAFEDNKTRPITEIELSFQFLLEFSSDKIIPTKISNNHCLKFPKLAL